MFNYGFKNKPLLNKFIFILSYFLITSALSLFFASQLYHDKKDISYDRYSLTESHDAPSESSILNIPLDKGIYTVSYAYSTEYTCYADIYPDGEANDILTETAFLENYKKYTEHRLYVKKNTTIDLVLRNSDLTNSLSLTEIKIHYNKLSTALCRFIISIFIFISAPIFILFIYNFFKKYDTSAKIRSIFFIGTFIIICFPALFFNSTFAHDNSYHLSRISGIAEGLKNSMFPVRLHLGTHYDHGYPSGIYYGDLLLYLPALLYMAGFPLYIAYKSYIVFINILTLYSSYICFSTITEDKNAGTFGSLMYGTAGWYIIDVYLRGALGEFTAMSFLPFVVLGLALILSDKPELKRGSFYLILGFTGLIQSHHLTTLIIFVFSLFICLCFIPGLFRKKRLPALFISALICFMINLCFIVPFLDYYINVKVSANEGGSIQRFGTDIVQWFTYDYNILGVSGDISEDIGSDMPQTVGISLLIVLILSVIYAIISKSKLKKKILFISFLSVLSLFMTTHYFPYDEIQKKLPFLYSLIGRYIQYPFRYFTVSAVLLSLLSSIVFSDIFRSFKNKSLYIIPLIIFIVSCYSGITIMNEITASFALLMPLDNEGLHFYQGDPMYVAEGIDIYSDDYKNLNIYSDNENIDIYDEKRSGFEISADIVNRTSKKADVTFPLWYYPGYKLYTSAKNITMTTNNLNEIVVKITPGFYGKITLKYEEPWYWRASEIFSLISLIIFLFVYIRLSTEQEKTS